MLLNDLTWHLISNLSSKIQLPMALGSFGPHQKQIHHLTAVHSTHNPFQATSFVLLQKLLPQGFFENLIMFWW